MPIKIYSSLDEGLEDIEFNNGRGLFMNAVVPYSCGHRWPWVDIFFGALRGVVSVKTNNEGGDWATRTYHLVSDLISNAYRHGVENYPDKTCTLMAHIGIKGLMLGTKQEVNFFKPEQIALLLRGKNVKSTTCRIGGYGTQSFVASDGLFIDSEKMEIYVSRYFPK